MRVLFFSLIIVLLNLESVYGQSLYKIKEDCLGAYNKRDLSLIIHMAVSGDSDALAKMMIEGRVHSFREGQWVYLINTSSLSSVPDFLSAVAEVRPEGATYTVWVCQEFIEYIGSPSESYQLEKNHGDTKIYLKNGSILRGKIIRRTKNGIYLEVSGSKKEIFISYSEIDPR